MAALKRVYRNVLVSIEIYPEAGVPYTQARLAYERAKKLRLAQRRGAKKDSFERQDQIWVIFDRDEHPRFDEAVQFCANKNIGVGRSNPCFEVWLILHEQEYHKPDDRKSVQAYLKSIRPEYDAVRGKIVDCDAIISRVEEAEMRAETQLACRVAEGNPFGPPSTTMHELTRAIREACNRAI